MSTTRSRISATGVSLYILFSLFLISYTISYHPTALSSRVTGSSAFRTALVVLAGLSLATLCLIVVARTTMVAWITILVLLAFSGKRRRVLVHEGRQITTDVTMHVIKVIAKEHRFVTVICATVVSLMAMSQVTSV